MIHIQGGYHYYAIGTEKDYHRIVSTAEFNGKEPEGDNGRKERTGMSSNRISMKLDNSA